MKVDLVAYTKVDYPTIQTTGFDTGGRPVAADADVLAEFAGRACYQSWKRPNPATATVKGYLANILDHKHFSVLEHASATFYLQGVSRSLLAELTRHRHLSFSVLSQRYVDETYANMVTPPALRGDDLATAFLAEHWEIALNAYDRLVEHLTERKGLPRKQAREAARCVLPNMTETRIVVTGNHRAWREVIAKRNSPHADAEIRELAAALLHRLKRVAPASYQDIEE